MTMRQKHILNSAVHLLVCLLIGFIMAYPLLWMVGAAFKQNGEIYNNSHILPRGEWVLTSWHDGWYGVGTLHFDTFIKNSIIVVVPNVLFTILSCTLTAYGFARFRFIGKKVLFMLMLSLLMLPNAVIQVPTYILFRDFGWLNSYKPLIVPSMFASSSFLIFMLVQFFRGIPKDLDESATIDGCGSIGILFRILVPLCLPAMVSAGLFQFLWSWNDYFHPMLYLNSTNLYTVSLGLRMSLDATTGVQWNNIMAMSTVSILPCVVLFFCLQKHFVEGIAAGGLKG